jgi:hypothetical protein
MLPVTQLGQTHTKHDICALTGRIQKKKKKKKLEKNGYDVDIHTILKECSNAIHVRISIQRVAV